MTIGSELDAALAAATPAPPFDPAPLNARIDQVAAAVVAGNTAAANAMLQIATQLGSEITALQTAVAALQTPVVVPPPVPVTPPPNTDPVWQTVPTITFTQGIAGTISVAGFVSSPLGLPLTLAEIGALPLGIAFDSANQRFFYDGFSPVGKTSVNLTAADGRA